MHDPRLQDLEALEAINQDETTRQTVLRMVGLARGGRMPGFIAAVHRDLGLDEQTKDEILELARGRELPARRRGLPEGDQAPPLRLATIGRRGRLAQLVRAPL
jgi:hypothetical protein